MTNWYHGGYPGLLPGMKVLPRSQTGVAPSVFVPMDGDETEPDYVYLTKSLEHAKIFAAAFMLPSGGSVYRVEPAGDLHGDPYDLGPGRDAQRCSEATVIECVVVRVPSEERLKIRSALGELADPDDLMGPEVGSAVAD